MAFGMMNNTKQITDERCIELMKENFPKFLTHWEDFIRDFGSDQGITIQMIPFGEFTIETIKANNETEIKKIFDFVEFLICNGDQSVRNALTTGFLEFLLSKYPDELNFRPLVKYLGEQSIGYCRAWDEFCGMRTEGLWDDE